MDDRHTNITIVNISAELIHTVKKNMEDCAVRSKGAHQQDPAENIVLQKLDKSPSAIISMLIRNLNRRTIILLMCRIKASVMLGNYVVIVF